MRCVSQVSPEPIKDMTEIRFLVPETPKGKARPRFSTWSGQVRTYTPESTKQFENLVHWYSKQAMGERHPFPKEVPVSVDVKACFPVPSSYSKKKREACLNGTIKHTKKPDCDNVLKAVCDPMNKTVFWDDSQVFQTSVEKVYCDGNRGYLEIVVKAYEE